MIKLNIKIETKKGVTTITPKINMSKNPSFYENFITDLILSYIKKLKEEMKNEKWDRNKKWKCR